MGNSVSSDPGCVQCCESRTGDRDSVPVMTVVGRNENNRDERTSNLHGVGLVFRTTRDGKMIVSSFVKDSSAYECGLVRDGDILSSVQGQSVESLPLEEIHKLLLGEKDSWVQMRFLRQTDAKTARMRNSGSSDMSERMLGQGPGDTVWASSKMRSFAPTYDTILVDLCRKTPSNILSEAASQAQEEAMSLKNKYR
mmetsp:Transcript_6407/g.22911  ORF Transcript_6407/g.22911 Transcript_6407/m.22911 type:complete len:196 (-) Transcript_6407:111-698(-)